MNNQEPRDPDELRRQAIERLNEKQMPELGGKNGTGAEETAQTLHELRVHHIELEMQNEVLRTHQAELEAGRARYHDLYDLAPVGFCTLCEQGLILEANLTAATMLGTPRGALVKQPISRFIFKDDQDIYYLHREKLFEADQLQECELQLVKPDDTIIWAHLTAIAAEAEDGTSACRLVLTDITERKGAEEALRDSERKYQTLIHQAPAALFLHTIDGSIMEYNQLTLERYGYSADEILTMNASDIDPDYREREDTGLFWEELTSKGQLRFEARHRKKGGVIFPVEINLAPIEIKGKKHYLAMALDITERKGAEESLRESNERFHDLFEKAPLGYQSLDSDGRFIDVNVAWLETLGYSREEVIGKWFGDFLAPEYMEAFNERFPVFKAQGKVHSEFYMMHKDGSRIYVAFDGRIGNNADGSFKQTHCILKDETERKRAEEALRESEALLSRSQEISHTGSWKLDLATNRLSWSDEVYRIFGCQPQAFVPTYEAFLDFVHPDDRSAVDGAYFRSGREGNDSYEIEHRIVRRNSGEVRYVHERCLHERDASGTIVQSTGMVQDITERKQAEKVLNESRKKYMFLVENLNEGVWQIDRESRTVFVNPRMAEMLGYSVEEMLGMNIFHFMSEKGRKIAEGNIDRRKNGIKEEHEFEFLGKDGHCLYASLATSPIFDDAGEYQGALAGVQDITERKQAEAKLLELNMAVEQSGDGIALSDMDGNIRFVNKTWVEMHGYAAEELIGRHLSIFHTPEQMEKEVIPFNEHLMAMGSSTGELGHCRKDGSTFTTYMTTSVVKDATGNLFGLLATARDITERKLAETYREIEREILQILNEPGDLQESIQRVLDALKTRTGVDAVGLRLQEGEDYPYFAQDGFPEDFLQTENTLVERGKDGGVCRDKDGNVCLQCTCGLVISGKTDPANPLFTKGGSSWTNDSFPFLDLPSDQDPRLHPRNNCIHQGYASVALIPVAYTRKNCIGHGYKSMARVPIQISDRIVGLIQLNDKRKDRFTLEAIEILESIATHIGSALMRKQAEREMRRLSTAIEQSPETVVITDTEGTIQYVNPAFETTTGYTCEEAIGQNPRILQSGQHDAEFYAAMWKTLLDGRVWQGRIINKRKDGSLYTEEAAIAPVKDSNGTITSFVAGKRDMTAELKREDMLRQAQKMESVGRLAGGVAHDFNNMLMVILGQAELLAMKLADDDPNRRRVADILQAAQRSAKLTRQLLAFARKETIAPVPLDLNNSVEDLLKMLRRLIGEDIDLSWQPGTNLWPVKMDPSQLDQILANLCVNARDAIGGVGKITIETENASLNDAYCRSHTEARPGHFVVLAVSDDGRGMDAETMSQVFEPFFTTKPTGEGTGLGLATVYGIIKQNMGFVNVYSEPDEGTTFRIYMPRLAEAAVGDEERLAPAPCPRGSETVLLVEDEPAVRAIAQAFLKDLGYRVLEADCPATALGVAAAHPGTIDLLLTDVVMPGMNGRNLAERLTAVRPQLRVLYMSGYTANTIVHRGVLDQGVQFISKPFTLEELARKVREVLG